MRRIFISALLMAFALTGCSQRKDHDNTQTQVQTEKVAQAAEQVVVAAHNQPANNGVFFWFNGKLDEVQAGELEALMPTNAERGFGFKLPIGGITENPVQDISVMLDSLDLTQLQLSRFQGVSVLSDGFISPVDDTNVAWLPEKDIQMQVNIIDRSSGFAEIHFEKPLEPGFYVLHDDSMLRARKAGDVSGYYPFVVQRAGGQSVWEIEADKCFKAMQGKNSEHISLTEAEHLDQNALKTCVNTQRIAWKYLQNVNPKGAEQLFARLVYLNRLYSANDREVHLAMLRLMNSEGEGLFQTLWKVEQFDLLQRLAQIHKALNSGDSLSAEVVQAVVDYYQPSSRVEKAIGNGAVLAGAENHDAIAADSEKLLDALALMNWVPFASIEDTHSSLESLMNGIVQNEDRKKWILDLVSLMGAVQYHKIFATAQNNKKLMPWFKRIDASVYGAFKSRASSLAFRAQDMVASLGPYQFDGVDSTEVSSWRATLMAKENEVRACITVSHRLRSGLYLIELPLNGVMMGKVKSGVVRDPLDSIRPVPAMTPEMVDCILKSYATIPQVPSFDTTQRARVVIAVSEQ